MDSGDAKLQVELQPTATATNLTRSLAKSQTKYLSTPQVRPGHEIVSCANDAKWMDGMQGVWLHKSEAPAAYPH